MNAENPGNPYNPFDSEADSSERNFSSTTSEERVRDAREAYESAEHPMEIRRTKVDLERAEAALDRDILGQIDQARYDKAADHDTADPADHPDANINE